MDVLDEVVVGAAVVVVVGGRVVVVVRGRVVVVVRGRVVVVVDGGSVVVVVDGGSVDVVVDASVGGVTCADAGRLPSRATPSVTASPDAPSSPRRTARRGEGGVLTKGGLSVEDRPPGKAPMAAHTTAGGPAGPATQCWWRGQE